MRQPRTVAMSLAILYLQNRHRKWNGKKRMGEREKRKEVNIKKRENKQLNNSRGDKHRGKIESEKERRTGADPHGKSNKGRKRESAKPRKSDIRTFSISVESHR